MNLQDGQEMSPLHWAVDIDSIELVQLVIKNGADINL